MGRRSNLAVERGRLGGLIAREAAPERIAAAERDLKTAAAEQYIRRLVDEAPPLTTEQRARLAALLAPGREARAA